MLVAAIRFFKPSGSTQAGVIDWADSLLVNHNLSLYLPQMPGKGLRFTVDFEC